MENQSGLKALTFHRQYLLSETTEMVWKINFWAFFSHIYLYCKGQPDYVTATADSLRQDADSSLKGGNFFVAGGRRVCAPRCLQYKFETLKINEKKVKMLPVVSRLDLFCTCLDSLSLLCIWEIRAIVLLGLERQ